MERKQTQWLGIALVVLGALLLLGRVIDFDMNFGRFAWPLFILVPGALLLAVGITGPRSSTGLTVPGSVLTAIGAILLWQSLTGRFETWSYLWALIPTAVGVGLYLQGNASDDEELRQNGRRTGMAGLTMLLVFGAFFELFIFGNFAGGGVGRILIPVLLIGGGVYLLVGQRRDEPALPEREPEG